MDEQEISQINMTSLTLLSFELEVIQEWIDPFDSTALKILTGITYTVGVLASIPILAFVVYETGGYAGHFRTVINQLLSFIYGVVSKVVLGFVRADSCVVIVTMTTQESALTQPRTTLVVRIFF